MKRVSDVDFEYLEHINPEELLKRLLAKNDNELKTLFPDLDAIYRVIARLGEGRVPSGAEQFLNHEYMSVYVPSLIHNADQAIKLFMLLRPSVSYNSNIMNRLLLRVNTQNWQLSKDQLIQLVQVMAKSGIEHPCIQRGISEHIHNGKDMALLLNAVGFSYEGTLSAPSTCRAYLGLLGNEAFYGLLLRILGQKQEMKDWLDGLGHNKWKAMVATASGENDRPSSLVGISPVLKKVCEQIDDVDTLKLVVKDLREYHLSQFMVYFASLSGKLSAIVRSADDLKNFTTLCVPLFEYCAHLDFGKSLILMIYTPLIRDQGDLKIVSDSLKNADKSVPEWLGERFKNLPAIASHRIKVSTMDDLMISVNGLGDSADKVSLILANAALYKDAVRSGKLPTDFYHHDDLKHVNESMKKELLKLTLQGYTERPRSYAVQLFSSLSNEKHAIATDVLAKVDTKNVREITTELEKKHKELTSQHTGWMWRSSEWDEQKDSDFGKIIKVFKPH